jgi:hypothetical protein
VAAVLQQLIGADLQAYVGGELPADLDAALQPLLSLELAPTRFGELQSAGLLTIKEFDLVFIRKRGTFYYRDHYVKQEDRYDAQEAARRQPDERAASPAGRCSRRSPSARAVPARIP